MTWVLVGSAAIAVVGGTIQSNKANKAARAQEKVGVEDEIAGWENNLADNQAIAEANVQNTIRTGYRQGILNMQRAQARREQAQQGFSLGRNVQQVLSATSANAAAAGTVGQSVDAVVADVQEKADEVQAQLTTNALQTEANFDLQAHDIRQTGQDALRDPTKAMVRETAAASTSGFGEVLLGAGLQVGSQYLQANMSLKKGS